MVKLTEEEFNKKAAMSMHYEVYLKICSAIETKDVNSLSHLPYRTIKVFFPTIYKNLDILFDSLEKIS